MWENGDRPRFLHERLVGFGNFAAEHEGATALLGYAAQAVSYAVMGPMAAMRDIAIGSILDQARDYAIEKVGDYYQSKGVRADNADILATGTVFGAEVAIGEVGSAVKGAQRYAMRMEGESGLKGNQEGGAAVKWGAQEKHFPGHNSYTPGRSILTADPRKLAESAGTRQQVGSIPVGMPGSKERVDFGGAIGTYIAGAGAATSTTNGIIHYSKDGIHIVPARL